MTQLTDYLNQGYKVLVSPLVEPDTVVAWNEPPTEATVIFHPLNYNYIAYEDPFRAHELNMAWIREWVIERRYQEALQRLNDLVDEMNADRDVMITGFFPHTTVQENEDGSFTFFAAPQYARGEGGVIDLESLYPNAAWGGYSWEEQRALFKEYQHRDTIDEGFVISPGQKATTYQTLKERLGREPNFDELIRGY